LTANRYMEEYGYYRLPQEKEEGETPEVEDGMGNDKRNQIALAQVVPAISQTNEEHGREFIRQKDAMNQRE